MTADSKTSRQVSFRASGDASSHRSKNDCFICDPDRRAIPRGPGTSGTRAIGRIELQELKTGLVFTAEIVGPEHRADLVNQARFAFGFDRTGELIAAAFDHAIETLLAEGVLEKHYWKLKMSERE